MSKSTARAANNQITFDYGLSKPVVVDHSAGDVVNDGGLVLLRAADDRLRLAKKVAACIEDKRSANRIDHSVESLVRQVLFQKGCGYEDTNDADYSRENSLFRAVCGEEDGLLASYSTMQRLENSVTANDLMRIQELLPKLYLSRFRCPPQNVTLYMDSTVDPVDGNQQLSFYNGFYKEHCYTDLFLVTDEGFPLGGVVRAGNAAPAEGSMAMLNRAVQALRSRRKKMNILFVADSAFGSFQMYDFLEDERIDYFIGIGTNNALQSLAKPFVEEAARLYDDLFGERTPLDGDSWRRREERIRHASKEEGRMQEIFERDRRVRLYAEVQYAARSWSRERRVLIRIEFTEEGADLRFVVTNYVGNRAKWLYEEKYCKRARCENNIKELKFLRCDKLSAQEYLPNQFRLLQFLLAYVLLLEVRNALPRPVRKMSVHTLLLRFIKIGTLIQRTTRAFRIRMSSSHPWKDDFYECLWRLQRAI